MGIGDTALYRGEDHIRDRKDIGMVRTDRTVRGGSGEHRPDYVKSEAVLRICRNALPIHTGCGARSMDPDRIIRRAKLRRIQHVDKSGL